MVSPKDVMINDKLEISQYYPKYILKIDNMLKSKIWDSVSRSIYIEDLIEQIPCHSSAKNAFLKQQVKYIKKHIIPLYKQFGWKVSYQYKYEWFGKIWFTLPRSLRKRIPQ